MPISGYSKANRRPMNVHVMRGSPAELKYRSLAGVADLEPAQIAPGIAPTPTHDLLYHGGKTIQDLTFTNYYVGEKAWNIRDIKNIDAALDASMSDPNLNNVMAQYFARVPTSTFIPSTLLPGPAPDTMSQGDVENLVSDLFDSGTFESFDLTSTVFNFMLPRGTILNDNPAPGANRGSTDTDVRRPSVPEAEEADSLHGLGGYHGSVQIHGMTIYYAVGVYSESANGKTNGIPVFDAPWKNVVATFYHELNEARTDPDVERVIKGGASSLLGWTSSQGEECGDFPVFEANPLGQVFQEVTLVDGDTAPVQFQYSNYVHGPEGPATTARPASKLVARHKKRRAA